ncbi:MAG: ubiquinol-cytochrome c reductase iron-sulfur subunit [Nitriliruptoraceae bacterium]
MADQKETRKRLELKPLERRTFLRYSLIGSVGAGLGGFGLASLGFLWPRLGDELVGEVDLGNAFDLLEEIDDERAPIRIPEGGISILAWDPSDSNAMTAYGEDHAVVDEGEGLGLMAVNSQSCPHLGCAVPWCQTSQWFECPCHGSRYNRYGEWTGGPAPRGLDRYVSFVEDERFIVNLSEELTGPARTANVLEQSPEGPSCVDA